MCTRRVKGTIAISAMPMTAWIWYVGGTPAIRPTSGCSVNRLRAQGAIVSR